MNKTRKIQFDPRRGHYLVQVRRDGVRRHFFLGTSRKQARLALAELEKALALGTIMFRPCDETTIVTHADGRKDIRVEELAHLHLEWVNKNKAEGTFKNRQRYVLQFLHFIGGVMVSQISRQQLEEFFQLAKERGRGENGGIEALAGVKAMLRWGEEQEICELAFKRFPKMSHVPPTVTPLDDGELQKLLEAAPPDFKDLLTFGMLTGLRPGELRGMTRDMVRTKASGEMYVCIIRHKTTKSARVPRPRTVALCGDAVEIVKRQLAQHPESPYLFLNADGTQFCRYTYRNRLRRLSTRAGLRRVTPYLLRHTFATWESEAGVESTALSQMMGHTTTRTLERYVSNTHAHHKKAVELIADRIRNQTPTATMESPSVSSEERGSPLLISGGGSSVGRAPTAKQERNVLPNVLPDGFEVKEVEGEVVVSDSEPPR